MIDFHINEVDEVLHKIEVENLDEDLDEMDAYDEYINKWEGETDKE